MKTNTTETNGTGTSKTAPPTATPGPWRLTGSRCLGWTIVGELPDGRGDTDALASCPDEANARLIAAAPELMSALKAMLAYDEALRTSGGKGDPYGTTYTATTISGKRADAMLKARTALAKARGKP